MIKLQELLCNKCGHKWIPRKEKPIECPRCKSYKYSEKSNDKPKK